MRTGWVNQQAVLREIALSGPASRTQIAARIGLSAGAVSRIARPLIDAGLVRELPEKPSDAPPRPGRRFVPLDIDPKGGQVLGIRIGPTLQTVTLADIKNNTIASSSLELDTLDDPDQVIRRLARESRRLIGAHVDDRSRLLGGLIMVAGQVDPARGEVVSAPYLGWRSVPLQARFADVLDLPVTVQSMATTIALTEMLFGAGRGWNNSLTLLCGLGIGAAVILDGRLVTEASHPTEMIGNMKVTGDDRTVATLDELVSGLGVLRRLHGDDMTPGRTPLPKIGRALHEAVTRDQAGDRAVSALMAAAGRELGRVIVQFARFVVPEVVVIAGPLSRSPAYMAATGEAVAAGMAPNPARVVCGAVTEPGERSVTCAMAIYEHLLERPAPLPA